ncbi:MAG: hypothetical protein AAFY52_01330 [Pseudomonadota bacterium]
MKPTQLMAAATLAASLATGAFAQANLTAETASPTGVPGNTVLALAEVAAGARIANIQVAGEPCRGRCKTSPRARPTFPPPPSSCRS